MFASETKINVTVGTVEVTLRKLSAKSLEKAAQARQIEVAQNAKLFDPDFIKAMRSREEQPADDKPAVEPTDEQKRQALYAIYDRSAVLVMGVVAWTHSRKLNQESLDDLDEETADSLFHSIIDLSKPTQEEQEAQEGKDSGASTSS